ncbi:MAG TPA: hypothetical protein VFE91_07855 [Nitrososphaerales archaeon]|nr:hypothetical protein [Nitrososphaerales archaeon]
MGGSGTKVVFILIIGLLAISTFAPQKAAASSYYQIGAKSADPKALSNTGVRTTVQVVNTPMVGCLSFWISDELTNSVWGQIGYVICNGSTPWAFCQVWNMVTRTMMDNCPSGFALSTGYHTFTMMLQSGNTWVFQADGKTIGSFNLGASLSSSTYPVYTVSEESGVAGVLSFPTVEFSSAMQVLKAGVWYTPIAAKSYVYGLGWGVQGTLQNHVLGADQMLVGLTIPKLASGNYLWNS